MQLAQANQTLEDRVVQRTQELEAAMARLRAMARTDGLLGIANRAHFHERLEQVCALALRGERPVGVLMVDVDCFKAFNDHYGHLHGDACLQKIAKALTGCLYRTSDLVARYGGEELVVLLPDTNLAGAQQVAQRMVEAVAQLGIAHQASPVAPVVTISVGVCAQIPYAGPDNASGSAALLACADAALYRAKNQGRNRWVAG